MKIPALLLSLAVSTASVAEDPPWPADVPGWKAPEPGEHPRLFFRKADLAKIRERAKTPEGQAIIARLRVLLNGSDGETMPALYNASCGAYQGNRAVPEAQAGKTSAGAAVSAGGAKQQAAQRTANKAAKDAGKADADDDMLDEKSKTSTPAAEPAETGKGSEMPIGTYSIGHAAGYGLLYQLTGEKKYADLGRKCFEKAFAGVRDRDDRYSWKVPGGALRAGPSLGIYAIGYDLCYDGWDEDFRKQVATAIATFNEGSHMSIEELARGARHFPGKNHWGGQVGGAALALLAVRGDAGAEAGKVDDLLKTNAEAMIKHVTEGFGDGGYYAEDSGPGGVASDTAYVPALQAWKVAGGKDFISPRPNASGITLIKLYQLLARNGQPYYTLHPGAYGASYGTEAFARLGLSRGGHFAQGFGAVKAEQVPALLWVYQNVVEPGEAQGFLATDGKLLPRESLKLKPGEKTYDALQYPHRAVLSFVNWPIGVAPKNPAEVLPKVHRDTKRCYWLFRNQWKDESDILVSMHSNIQQQIMVWGLGMRFNYGKLPGCTLVHQSYEADGSGAVSNAKGDAFIAVDYSKKSGAEALIAVAGKAGVLNTKEQKGIGGATAKFWKFDNVGGKPLYLCTLQTGPAPEAKQDGDKVIVGGQTVSFDGSKVLIGK